MDQDAVLWQLHNRTHVGVVYLEVNHSKGDFIWVADSGIPSLPCTLASMYKTF
jgi:hypothetical protein